MSYDALTSYWLNRITESTKIQDTLQDIKYLHLDSRYLEINNLAKIDKVLNLIKAQVCL